MDKIMSAKPHTYIADLANLPKALQHITKLERWVVWRWELRTKKNGAQAWTKPPFQCSAPHASAKSNDPSTWGTYEEAVAAVAAGNADGIGFMLKDSEVAAADLDHVRDANTGELIDWAKSLCAEADRLGLYREVTVSGCGLRFIGLAPQGAYLQRSFIFDRKSHAGVELYRNCARYITISGMQEGSCEQLGQIGDYLDILLARFEQQPKQSEQPDVLDFNTAGPQAIDDYYRDLIENGAPEGERSEKFQEVVWYLASLGWSIEQIVDELAKHPSGIGLKYATRLLAEVTRSFGKWQAQRRTAATGSSAPTSTPWPQIRIIPGEITRVVNEAEDALLLLGREIYQRGGLIVRPVLTTFKASQNREIIGWQLIPVIRPYLVDTLTCAAQFYKYNARSKKWANIDAPDKVAEIYLSRRGRWKLPTLSGVIHTPFLRTDGSICETPGYDVKSGLLFKPDDQLFPLISQFPDKQDAIEALERLDQLISTFPFVAKADRSVALSALLTILDRRSMNAAPLHACTSPSAGTGKSLLVDIAAILATGRAMPVISQGRSEEELEKRIGAALLAGDTAISLDNCDRPLESVFLCQVLTQPQLNIRILGQSRNVETPINATVFATGNNLVIGGDATRRTLLCSMDAGCERPELRVFNNNVVEIAKDQRGELASAALTVLRAWHLAAPQSRINLTPFGSFEEWSFRIREPLVWLGKLDPCETLGEVRENDPNRAELATVIMQWKDQLGVGAKYTVQQVIERAVNIPSFYTALLMVAPARTGSMVSNIALGRWLKRVQGKIVNGLKLIQDGNTHGYPLWRLA
jgi:hypothetical protein